MFKAFLTRFIKDERGVTAIEYGLIAVAIAVAIGGAVLTIGDELLVTFNEIAAKLTAGKAG
ncbi:hypothetical protein A9264_04460 [Vibrio sp. UCD-FRSSP16_10]|uniref:Flp family type IVb pilin n=1 Tax=unclassified Vibrio TaxID=2614977 RepID=UPI00080147B6|nr:MULTISPECIES: Flp family type IVb pilin [unclassified Vibrio]OBT08491.1 hypothetical protein A9260_06700 [Vibrio sp. UCD-FRSSP16_30]OBT18021.1 hypothetical protein A9264_04460 [Vibrio sp. UCD-FRSSP16_10]